MAHADARHQVISRAALDAAIYEDSVARLIGNLRGLTEAPIHLIPEPLPSEKIIKTDEIWSGEYMPSLYEIYIEQLKQLVLAHRAELISQDADTIVHGAFTAARYSIGAVGLYGKDYDRKEDFRHMNAQFGAELINKSLTMLRGRSAGTRENGFSDGELAASTRE
jgi:hypothetical protein